MDIIKAPEHFSEEAAELWNSILEEYELEPADKAILKVGLEAYDRLQLIREQIALEGATVTDPSGRVRAHPALQAEKQAASVYLQAFRLLALNEDPPLPVGRPAGR